MQYSDEHLRYLRLLSQKYKTVAAAASEIIRIEALLRLPKGTEHFMSDLHGEHEAFVHILNSASGVIHEKIDTVLGPDVPAEERAELATLVYYPNQKLPELKARQPDLHAWYRLTLLRLIDLCRFVSSKHTRDHVRRCLPQNCGYILDELLHAHFEDHDKDQYYGEIIESILRYDRADAYIVRFCEVIKRLAVDRLHIVGDLFDRGPRPDRILDSLMAHHQVDIQWGNHDVVWMGAAAGSPLCIMTVLKTTLAYNNLDTLEGGYGISLRQLERFAQSTYADSDVSRWIPHADPRTAAGDLTAAAQMHKAVTVMMLKLEAQVIARNPDFDLQGRDFLNHIDFAAGTVDYHGTVYPLLDCDFPTVDPAAPTTLTAEEAHVIAGLVRSFAESERLQRHVQFLYAHGAFYKICNGNLLYHGAVPMTEDGAFAAIRFEGVARSGKQLFDYCDRRARQGYSAPPGSPARLAGQDFLWYLWCGAKSPLFGRSAMTTFERLYIADPAAHREIKDPYYKHIAALDTAERILREFGLAGAGCHIVNGHVPVRAIEGESPIKGGGRLIIIDGGFCRAYHQRTGIAGYTLVYNSRGLILRTHQPFESAEKAIHEDEDIASKSEYIYTAPQRILVRDTDEGGRKQALIRDLCALVEAYQTGVLPQGVAQEM
ncbi:MAG: fructose-1,6-bisphosphatase [Gemmiger sp.]|uniref:fructose-1,6-bisphosphatase n=1 Tax=Gemmiger sp. TaxID=2049027 RepID=UPI002E791A62|nr:fructose-1,6-bisphosphatase [Gemmiger sp.]MEE0098147.1 fructose-1,6-bisphosphatase [Gemmiger sp.]